MAESVETRETRDAATVLIRPRLLSAGLVAGYLLPLLVFAGFLLLWQFLPRWLGFHTYEVPNLGDTITGLRTDWSAIGTALLVTLQDAVLGFVLGNALAILGATIFSYSRLIERAFYPLAILVQTIPILVYAPIFVILFYRIGPLSANAQSAAVVSVAVLITFFPTLVNMTVGLKTIDPNVYEFMRLLNASRTQIFLKLRFPSALPFLFSSLRITSTLAFVGALVGEFMVGGGYNPVGRLLSALGLSNLFGFPTNPDNAEGVGYQLQVFYSQLDKPGIFADVVAVSLLSIAFFGLMVLLERIFVPWQKQQ